MCISLQSVRVGRPAGGSNKDLVRKQDKKNATPEQLAAIVKFLEQKLRNGNRNFPDFRRRGSCRRGERECVKKLRAIPNF